MTTMSPMPSIPAGHVERGWSDVWAAGRRTEVLTVGAAGSPVVFLHGWGLSPRSYVPSLVALAGHGHRIVAPSLPGFGKSAPLRLREQNVRGVADHIAAVLDELAHPRPVDVVGHSFGGGVAMRIAATRPDLVKSLTLICPVGGAGEGAVPLSRLVSGVIFDARHRWVGRALHDVGNALTHHPTAVAATAWAAWRSDQLEDLTAIGAARVPVRFVFAESDDVVTPGGIPACAFETVTCEVTHGRHSWLITDPFRFAASVAAYLSAGGARAA